MFEALSYTDILQEERERILSEVNHCHGPGRGHPCVGGAAWAHVQRSIKATARAKSIARRTDASMKRVGGDIQRALTLRKRFDVVGPIIQHAKQTSFFGTLFRRGPFRGKKR